MELNYSIIGMRLKQARISKQLTQEQLAEALDVSVAYVSRIERGSSKVNLKRLSQICSTLGISQGEILEGVTPQNPTYLNSAFNDLMKNCSSEKVDLIYKLAKVVVDDKNI